MDLEILLEDLQEKYQKVFNHHGELNQYKKFLEEASEFIDEISVQNDLMCDEKILEEGADLINMVMQHILDRGYNFDEILEAMISKIDRELKRIKHG